MKRLLTIAVLFLIPTAATAVPPPPVHRVDDVPAGVCPCCRTQCLKPWTVPDRWDDFSVPNHPEWVNNGHWDGEPFDDPNGNRLHDAGEPFTDQNGDGSYNEEFYHPFLTGYVAWKDNGRPILLKPGSPSDASVAGQYNAIDFASSGRQDESGNRYEWDTANCNQIIFQPGNEARLHPGLLAGPTRTGVLELIAKDPEVHWDPVTQQVSDELSPRIGFIALHDPRVGLQSGRHTVRISKVAAFFIDGIDADGNVIGRFLRVQSLGAGLSCPEDDPR